MTVLTTPSVQTVHGSIVDQSVFQQTTLYNGTSPSVYLTRILARMMSAAHSTDTVIRGLDVLNVTGQNTNQLHFTISPGSVVIDSNIVEFPNSTLISTDVIPVTAASKLRVGIFASYSFDSTTATNIQNNVLFTSYIFNMANNLIAPTLFGGKERILLASYDIDMTGVNLTPTMLVSDWIDIGGAATLANNANQLSVTNTQNYPGYGYISTTIPSGTLCDFTADVVSGNVSIKVGNTGPNSAELLTLSSNAATLATVIGSFTTTSNNQFISLGNLAGTAGNISLFDNVQVEYPSQSNVLIGDNSTFTNGVGSWVSNETNSAYWDGFGSMNILPVGSAFKDLVVGIDLSANSLYTISSTLTSNSSISVGTTGVGSSDILVNIPFISGKNAIFQAPATGTVSITISSTDGVTNATLADISIGISSIFGDSALFTATVGGWVPNLVGSASVAVAASQLVATNISGTVTGDISLPVTIAANTAHTLDLDITAFSSLNIHVSVGTTAGLSDIVAVVTYATVGTLSIAVPATASTLIYINITPPLVVNGTVNVDNVVLIQDISSAVLPLDNSSFSTSIGTWLPGIYSVTSNAGVLTLTNMKLETLGAESSFSQDITLLPNTKYQVEITAVSAGVFSILDSNAAVVTYTTSGSNYIFSTTLLTVYTFKYTNPILTIGSQVSISNINIFQRLSALSLVNSTFTSTVGWKTSVFDNITYAGNGLNIRDNLGFGAEVSRTISGLVIGHTYRVQCEGTSLSQILVGPSVGSGSLMTAVGVINSTFVTNATSVIVTLRVNSTVINAEATFRSIRIFDDNLHIARIVSPANTRSSGGNLKAISTNNPNKTMRTEIQVAGHRNFKVKGDDPITTMAEISLINALDASTASWVTDIPKMKPTSTSLVYGITGILF